MQPLVRFLSLVTVGISLPSLPAQGSFVNIGFGRAGTSGTPNLSASTPQVGKTLTITLTAARPGAMAFVIVGLRRVDLRIFGGTVAPAFDAILPTRVNASGTAIVTCPIPNDRRLHVLTPVLQCLVVDPLAPFSFAFSNALEGKLCKWFRTSENFQTSQFLDEKLSAGTWGNGILTFAPIGGSGIHGVFDPTIGKKVSAPNAPVAVYEWNTDRFVIPKTHTTTGKDETVTDGRFFFQTLALQNSVEVHFVGSNPARIWVCGEVEIDGLLDANGESLFVSNFPLSGKPNSGEPGGRGGAFGADGGAGGDQGDGLGNKPAFNGKDGQDIILPLGHAYAGQNKGTGGKGVPQWPLSGLKSAIIYSFPSGPSAVISTQMNRGAGGAGFRGAGGTGFVQWSAPNAGNQQYAAPGTTPGGIAMAFPPNFPKTYPPGWTHQDHFLVGGSGGGGGGSCCSGAIKGSTEVYRPARAGGGGGGALGMRVGGSLKLAASGRLEARGGDAAQDSAFFTTRNMPSPGGGGSGGSLFLQVNLDVINKGLITVRGGAAGKTEGNLGDVIFKGVLSAGGKGAGGILHFETAQDPGSYSVGRTEPASPPIAKLDPKERDDVVAVRSKWYATNLTTQPIFLRYEIEATIDGKAVILSDNPLRGAPARGPSSPLRFLVQGAQLDRDPNGVLRPKPNTVIMPHRESVGPYTPGKPSLFDDPVNGYRFELTLDRSLGKTVVVRKVTVVWCL